MLIALETVLCNFVVTSERIACSLADQSGGSNLFQMLDPQDIRLSGGMEGIAEANQPCYLGFIGNQAGKSCRPSTCLR